MTIDWITVSAQIVNFLVLVYLLKRFLYGPIVRAMDRREQTIAQTLDDANAAAEKAAHEKVLFEGKRRELESERDALLEKAREEVREERTRSLAELRSEIADERKKWRRDLAREQSNLLKDVRRALSERITGAVERILKDLANADLEREALKRFMAEIARLPEKERMSLVEKSRSEHVPMTFATAFALDEDRRDAIVEELRGMLGGDVDVRFEQSDELVCGAALELSGRRYSWNVDSYLEDLSSSLAEILSGADSDENVR